MKVLFHIFLLTGTFMVCKCISIPQNPEKEARYCGEICTSCGGPSFTENNICYCYVEKDVNMEKCINGASKKSAKFNILWEPIHAPTRLARKVRPVRGSFLDPIVANVFEKHSPSHLNNEALFQENSLTKGPIQRLFKRSIKKDLNAQDFDFFDFVDKMNGERKKRVPRSLAPSPKKKLTNLNQASQKFSNDEIIFGDLNNLIREKRNLAQFAGYPTIGSNQGNILEMLLSIPTLDDEDEKVQILFPNAEALDVSHEYYYEESDEINDDEDFNDDTSGSTWNRMSSNFNPYQSLYTSRQVYSTDPYLRGVRSLYLIPDSNQHVHPYGMAYCGYA